jgi:hypothetical protein
MSDLQTRALLDISTALLATQRELMELRREVEAIRASASKPAITLGHIATLIHWIGQFSQTRLGQSFIAGAIAIGAAFVKWG